MGKHKNKLFNFYFMFYIYIYIYMFSLSFYANIKKTSACTWPLYVAMQMYIAQM